MLTNQYLGKTSPLLLIFGIRKFDNKTVSYKDLQVHLDFEKSEVFSSKVKYAMRQLTNFKGTLSPNKN